MENSMKALLVRGSATLAAFALALAALGSVSARAATRWVSNRNDSGAGSLRQAIAQAASGDTITLGVTGTITLTSGALIINKDLAIEGPGPNKLRISGNDVSRVFVIQSGNVTLAGMTITDGLADVKSPIIASMGGGILAGSPAPEGSPISATPRLTLFNDVLSDNTALGNASASPFGRPGYAVAGGVANFGTLEATATQFSGNLARGGDHSISSNSGVDAGLAVGGAIGNWGSARITECHFTGNVARGADNSSGPASAGEALGGAIGNAADFTINDSTFIHNQALGGNNNSAPLPSNGLGGAIFNVGGVVPSGKLDVSDTRFYFNQAVGGNNSGLSGVPGGVGAGGAVESLLGTATFKRCAPIHNEALGGAGGLSASGGAAFGGGLEVANDFGGGSEATVSDSTVEHNLAEGGHGGPGGKGGDSRGGGLGSADGATVTVRNTEVLHNRANGGEGGSGANGGNGLGGGLYDDASSSLPLVSDTVSFNFALGGEAETGGSVGQGIGGGVYRLGTFSLTSSVIEKNHASTSGDNLAP